MLSPQEAIDRLRSAFRGPDGHRTLHAKGRFYAGTFTATHEATTLCRAGHLDGRPHEVLVRWSNASGNAAAPDKAPDIRGMAVKFSGGDGPFDLLGQTSPTFPTDDPEVFVALGEAGANPRKLPLFLATHPGLAPGLVKSFVNKSVASHHSFAETTFYPLHAYGWLAADGNRTWVRYVFRPTQGKGDRVPEEFTGPDRLSEEIAARLARGPVVHEVWVQVAGLGDDPHRITSSWKGATELLAGHLEVTGEAPDPEAGGSPTVFDPARQVEGIELCHDAILQFRPGAYSESVARRSHS
jgi:catalase